MSVLDIDDIHISNRGAYERDNDLTYINADEISYFEFYKTYLLQNKPCVIRGLTKGWLCRELWVDDGKPNFDFLKSNYGTAIAPVANCDQKFYDSQMKKNMTFGDYIDYWKGRMSSCEDQFGKDEPTLYLKDWHFTKEFPESSVYRLPEIFASDWLNEYLLNSDDKDDYKFVYMGPKGSWTPFHSDVMRSFSWSVNICGRKKWVFYAPGEENVLRDRFGNLLYSVDGKQLTELLQNEWQRSPRPYILFQEAGDAVFVPSGWHHQVWNVEDTISINHNWMNACNIKQVWEDLIENLSKVMKEIEDCREMEGWDDHCQTMLRAHHGMNVNEFCEFIFYIADVRLKALNDNVLLKTKLSDYQFGKNHMIFDLLTLRSIFHKILDSKISVVLIHENKILELIKCIEEYI